MIVVAIVGILATIAYPSYEEYVRRSKRAEVQALMQDLALRQQQRLLDTRAFAATLTALNVIVPPSIASRYTVTIEVGAGALPPSAVAGTVEVTYTKTNVDGSTSEAQKRVPFIIGGVNPKASPIEVTKVNPLISPRRQRSYWYLENAR